MGENIYIVITLSGAIAASYVAIFALYRWVSSQVISQDKTMDDHIQDRTTHPNADNLVYRDTCDANRAGLRQQVNNTDKKLDELKLDMNKGFDEIKALIRNGK